MRRFYPGQEFLKYYKEKTEGRKARIMGADIGVIL